MRSKCLVFLTPSLSWQDIMEGLAKKNHETEFVKSSAVVQAVVRHKDGLHAQSDYRKSGYAAGY